ncbi:ABC transporter permease [Ramlibacter sp. XY19]|uniref:ABC transporter permease n=1 Tax=Ramlibacter paludis TaxID=2908000 RepID=UPI0023DA37B6|nr:ABC transporter permease [Ramlibacter paludis]MCG2592909.1 ABC transporter permease [Ramlibacter paludis]
MNPWPVIRAALVRYRYSALAFVVLVAAGVTLAVAILSQERALREGSARAADRFTLIVAPPGSRTDALFTGVFLRPGSSQLLSGTLTAALLNDTRAAFVSPLAFGDSHHGAPVVGAIAPLVEHLSQGLAEGRVFATRNEAVVGALSDLKIGDTFRPAHGVQHGGAQHGGDDKLDAHDTALQVVGRMRPTGSPWDRAVVIPVETVWALHQRPTGHAPDSPQLGPPFDPAYTPGIPAAVVHTPRIATAYQLRAAYTGKESMAFFPAEALLQLYSVLGDMRQLMSLLAIVTQALVLAAIVSSVFILFRLLAPQFVTLRALGAPRRYVFAIAWGFTALLVGAGVLAGLAGGYALSFGIGSWLARSTGVALQPRLGEAEVLVALAIFVVGLLLATLPAWRIQRTDLAAALKGE